MVSISHGSGVGTSYVAESCMATEDENAMAHISCSALRAGATATSPFAPLLRRIQTDSQGLGQHDRHPARPVWIAITGALQNGLSARNSGGQCSPFVRSHIVAEQASPAFSSAY